MACYDDFPVSTVIYNGAVAGGLVALGAVVAAQLGAWVLVGCALLLAVASVGVLGTVCARCAGYYGRRCGLGLGKVVPLLFERGQADRYLRTPMQLVYTALLLVALAWPIVGSVILLMQGAGAGRWLGLVAAVGLLLALVLPHPRLVCRHCHQDASGACPVGSLVRK
jgi:hypothetical protein